jgi:hypothetical protein
MAVVEIAGKSTISPRPFAIHTLVQVGIVVKYNFFIGATLTLGDIEIRLNDIEIVRGGVTTEAVGGYYIVRSILIVTINESLKIGIVGVGDIDVFNLPN